MYYSSVNVCDDSCRPFFRNIDFEVLDNLYREVIKYYEEENEEVNELEMYS